MEELDLVERAKRGDAEAYEVLVRRYQDSALRLAYAIIGQAEEAEDAAQEALIKAYYALSTFRTGGSFRPWLLRIVANEARNRRKATRRRAALMSRAPERRPSGDAAPSPEAAALADEQRRTLWSALHDLREEDRLVLAYRYFIDLSEAETAEALGCARGTVKSRLSRALGRLRKAFARLGGDPAGLDLALVGLGANMPHLRTADLAAAVRERITSAEPSPGPPFATALAAVSLSLALLAAGVFALRPQARTLFTDRPGTPATPTVSPKVTVYGADLAEAERQQLAQLFGTDESVRAETVTREELVSTLRDTGLPVAPTDRAISSSVLTCLEPGAGLSVRTQHITRIPAEAYAAALVTAGVGDASILIAAPASNPVSGETALVGVLKAFPQCQAGKQPEADRVRLAYEQLAATARLAGEGGDLSKAAAVMLHALQSVIRDQAGDEAAIGAALDVAVAGEGLPMTAVQRSELVSLLQKLGPLDYGTYVRGYQVQQLGPDEVKIVPTGAGESALTRGPVRGAGRHREGGNSL